MKINNFTVIESEHGKFILNRHCAYQVDVMIKTGRPHIEEEIQKILSIVKTLGKNSVFIDAGANTGLISIPVAHAMKNIQGFVHAFEPQRMLAYSLCGSTALNDLENLHVYNLALGAEKKTIFSSMPDYQKPQDFGLFNPIENQEKPTHQTQYISIDSLQLPRLDFLKIDVEGSELDVLSGAEDSLEKYQPWCWIEFWKIGVEKIKPHFEHLDYDFYQMDELNMLCSPKARMQDTPLNINAKKL